MQQNVLVNSANPHEFYPIFVFPHVKLREKVNPVTDFGPEFQDVVDKMAATMYAAGGVGLAAPQVGLALHLFVIDTTEERNNLQVFANLKLTELTELIPGLEGCLSFPGVLEKVERAETVKGIANNRNGHHVTFEATEIDAVAIQHELDHLNGILIWDKVSKFKQRYMQKAMNNTMKKIPGGDTPQKQSLGHKKGVKQR
jgi:peptide deformylase